MLVTLEGMYILVIPVLRNAFAPIVVTPRGMVMEVSEVTSLNALSPILVTLEGILYEAPLLLRGY